LGDFVGLFEQVGDQGLRRLRGIPGAVRAQEADQREGAVESGRLGAVTAPGFGGNNTASSHFSGCDERISRLYYAAFEAYVNQSHGTRVGRGGSRRATRQFRIDSPRRRTG